MQKTYLLSALYLYTERDVKDPVQSSPGYNEAYQALNVLAIFAISSRLLKLKQTKEYATYSREFRDAMTDLVIQRTPEEVLQKLINTIFIMRLNQEQFKDKLAYMDNKNGLHIYDEFAAKLHVYAEAAERMNNLKKDNNDGMIKANKTTEHEANSNAYSL
jgi:hypothetical protein